MPLLTTLGNAGIKSYGGGSIIPGGSALFDANGDRFAITSPNPATAFAYGTGNFTIEMWLYPTSFSNYGIVWIQSTAVYFFTNITTGQMIFYYGQGTYPIAGAPTLNSWNHVAAVRNGSSATIFVNGIAYPSASISANIGNPDLFPTIGQWRSNDNRFGFRGYITNVRVAKQALYTANFTPQRVPFTRTSGGSSTTVLLLNMRNSATLSTDSSASPVTIDNNGVTFNTLSPYTGPYVTPPTVTVVSATVTPSTTTPGEGTTVTFTVAGTNTTNGTYYWTVEAGVTGTVVAGDFSGSILSGSFAITSNSGSFTVTPIKDLLTEGAESFVVFVRQTSTTGTVIGSSPELTITDVSITPAFTVTPANINEGSAGSFTVQNVGPDGTYYWTILNGTSANADFSAVSGSFSVSGSTGGIDNGSGSFTVTPVKDLTTEGGQTFQVEVRSGSTSGPVLVTSSSVTIIDTSVTPFVTPAAGSVNEGATLSVTAGNLGPDGTYYWTINHVTTAAADFTAENGSFIITGGTPSLDGGSGSFNITTVNDYSTEGAQTFTVSIRSGSISGTVLVTSSSITVNDTSTTVTASGSPTSFNEGASTTITASATAFPAGTYFWTILNGTTTNADFTAASGSFSVASNTGSFTVTAATLGGAEAAETFQVEIRTGSTSGPVIATTGTLTINASAT